MSGSDRFCDKWRGDYSVKGTDGIELHHLYRAMAFLGEEIEDQKSATPFAPRCIKDVVEERLFQELMYLAARLVRTGRRLKLVFSRPLSSF